MHTDKTRMLKPSVPEARRRQAERGVYATEGCGWESASEPPLTCSRFCGLKAALLRMSVRLLRSARKTTAGPVFLPSVSIRVYPWFDSRMRVELK